MAVDPVRVAVKRVGKTAGKGSSVCKCQILCADGVIVLRCCLYAVDLPAEFGNVEVHFHNTVLAPYPLYQDGVIGLDALAEPAAGAEGEAVLGSLLTDGTAATQRRTVRNVLLFHPAKFLKVESVVAEELLVFGCNDCTYHIVGNVLDGNPFPLKCVVRLSDALYAASDHKRGYCDRHPLQEGDQKNTGHHKSCRDVHK